MFRRSPANLAVGRNQATRVVTALSLLAFGFYVGILSVTGVSRVLQRGEDKRGFQICTASQRGLMFSSSEFSVMSLMCFREVDFKNTSCCECPQRDPSSTNIPSTRTNPLL